NTVRDVEGQTGRREVVGVGRAVRCAAVVSQSEIEAVQGTAVGDVEAAGGAHFEAGCGYFQRIARGADLTSADIARIVLGVEVHRARIDAAARHLTDGVATAAAGAQADAAIGGDTTHC